MAFLDSNLLISFAFINDKNHTMARELLNKLNKPFFVSPLALFEISASIPRRIIPVGGFRLPNFLQYILDCIPNLEEKLKQSIEIVISYLKDTLELTFCSDEECPELKEYGGVHIIGEQVKLFKLYALGMEKAYKDTVGENHMRMTVCKNLLHL